VGFSMNENDIPIRNPSGEGKRRQEYHSQEPNPYGGRSEDLSPMDEWIPGPIRSPCNIPGEYFGVPGWSLGGLVAMGFIFPRE
jgi:hypothetical protein